MLLEREELLAALGMRLAEAREGAGSTVLVAGEAGAGKTTLVDAFVAGLDDSVLVIRGACDPLTTPRPLGPLHDFAADPDSGLAGLADGTSTPVEMFERVLDRLRNSIRPIVMVVEDIHWADEGSLDFLRFIGRRVGDSKASVICTYRDDEVGADHPLRPVLGQIIPLASTHRIVVPSLTLAAVTSLAGESGQDPKELMRLTDGNAFFVTEIIATGSSTPHTVQEAVLSRVSRLADRPRQIVEGVSIAPRSLDMTHATALVGGTLDDVDAAVAAGVLVGDGRSLRFRHELARSAVETSLPPARRLGLHLRMLSLLEEDETTDLARMAHHAVRAHDSERVVEYAPRAAREASSRGSHKEAIAFYQAALEATAPLDPDEKAVLDIELSRELSIVDQTDRAVPHVESAISHFRASGRVLELGRALTRLSRVQWRVNDPDAAWQSLNEALDVLADQGPTPALGEAQFQAAYAHMLARHGEAARAHNETARATAEACGEGGLLWDVAMLDGTIAIVLGRPAEGVELLRKSAEAAKAAGDPNRVEVALSMLGSGGGEARFYDQAIPALNESIEHGLATDEDYSVGYSRSWLARIAFEKGEWDDAVRYADLVRATSLQPTGIAYITAMSALGRVRVRRGDPGGVSLLTEMTGLARIHELQHGWNAICGRAEHFWLDGEPERGLDHLAPAYDRALDTDSEWARGEIGFWMWRTGAIETPPEGAAEPFDLQMRGRWRDAAEAWRAIGCPYEVGMALADGDDEAKLEALVILDDLGAGPLGRLVRARLRASGVESIPRGPIRSTQANPAGLTDRQLEVLDLMADGLSNGEIAERLFISKKTVEHHVSAVFTKLGVDTRPRAIAVALETRAGEV